MVSETKACTVKDLQKVLEGKDPDAIVIVHRDNDTYYFLDEDIETWMFLEEDNEVYDPEDQPEPEFSEEESEERGGVPCIILLGETDPIDGPDFGA